jgi:hypothetical protein
MGGLFVHNYGYSTEIRTGDVQMKLSGSKGIPPLTARLFWPGQSS